MANYPTDLKYTKDHEWVRFEATGLARVGITQYAVDQLGDVTLVDLPKVGTRVEAHARFGDIESVKTVSELFAPVAGEVVEINRDLEQRPELVNESCYDKGWLILIRPSAGADDLMDAAAYERHVASLGR
jgi:glycine cleavage system H protein